MVLPDGVREVTLGDEQRLATPGESVYGEPTVDGWRVWGAGRSKLAAMVKEGLSIPLTSDSTVLYLGAGAGTTVSHLADVCKRVYALEFAPRPGKRLLSVAQERSAVIPLLKDVRRPETYAHVVESECDILVQDVATTGQAAIAAAHEPFLADDATLAISIKAPSEDVTAAPEAVFEQSLAELADTYTITDQTRLDRFHTDHLGVIATPE